MTDFQNVYTDEEVEQMWSELEDVTTYYDSEGRQRLCNDWRMWEANTDVEEDIWNWFNLAHTKGLGWLVINI